MIAQIAARTLIKLDDIFSHLFGWCAAVALAVVDYFAGEAFIVNLIVIVTVMDAVWGIALSVKRKRFALSELGRLTVAKLAVYGCAMFVFVGIDKHLGNNLLASVVGTAIVLVEFWSSCGSMSVLFPDFLFLRLMRKMLVGEIARKLNIAESDVDKELNRNANE